MPDGAKAKARKNIEEGRGISLGGMMKNRGVVFMNLVHLIPCGERH